MIKIYSKFGKDFFPVRATERSAGLDLKTPVEIKLSDGQSMEIDTGIVIDASEIDVPLWYLLVPRSSAGVKHGLFFKNTIGVIDQDYCGPNDTIRVHIECNDPDSNWKLTGPQYSPGERFCQLIIMPHLTGLFEDAILVEGVKENANASRGGVGSTGK